MSGLQNNCALFVVAYPVAWRVEVVNGDIHPSDLEYVRSERIVTPSGTAYICDTLAFTGESRRCFGTYQTKQMSPQRLDIERYKGTIIEWSHHLGCALGTLILHLGDLGVDPSGDQKYAHNPPAIRSGLPPFIQQGHNRAALHLCSTH